MNRAYSILEIKEFSEDQRRISGIATTPETDRIGDIIEPLGVSFKNPLPLLFHHDSKKPVGQVRFGKPTKSGIQFEADIARTDEPGVLKDRLDEAWQSVKLGLVRGVSIGFRVVNDAVERLKDGGLRFNETEVFELSLVTIPANASASIHTIKSIDEQLRAAHGDNANVPSSLLKSVNPPGASGKSKSTIPKGKTMRTIKERIADFQAARMAKAAQMQSLVDKQDGGATLDTAEQESFDDLDLAVQDIDSHLKRLERAEELNIKAATAVSTDATGTVTVQGSTRTERLNSGFISVRSNLEPGVKFARWVQAQLRGNFQPQQVLQAIEADKVWMRSTPELALVAKTAIPAADTTTTGWASELVYAENLANEFIEFLRPKTIVGRIPNFSRVPFNIRVGGMSSGLTGYWVGEGKAIPVSKGTTTSTTLGITKAAGIASFTKELARLSTPSAELLIRNELARAIVETIDVAFIDPNNGGIANEKPASILYGVTPVTPSGTTYATMRADIQSLMETSFDNNLDTEGSVWLMSHSTALKLAMMVNALDQRVNPAMTPNGGEFLGYPVIVSQRLQIAGSPQFNDIIIFLHPREIFLADDGQVTVEASDQVSLQLLDNPTNLSTGATAPTTVVSMFQTESVAVKAVRFINWGKRRTIAAQWIQAAAYVG